MRKRVGAIIIKNKKILLSRDSDLDFFDTPGGAVEEKENKQTALSREIKEELGVNIVSYKYIFTYDSFNTRVNILQRDYVYLVSIKETPKPLGEIIEIAWFSKDEILNKKIKTLSQFYDIVMPELIKQDLL